MGYYTSLIQRKFKDVVGKRYESVLREYGEFLLSEEEMVVPEIHSILLPLDIFVKEIPPSLYEVLSAYEGARVSLVYITDAQVYSVISEVLSAGAGEEFMRKKEEYGHVLLNQVSGELAAAGIESTQRMFTGHKGEDIEKLASSHDLVALAKSYGSEKTEHYPISPLAIRIAQRLKKPTILF
ncbi:MAG: universal stress protein [Methanomicrobiales archaeon]|nr:universal stress protein [Methanomicrobiales archaeon]